jgi:LDH2 family malate/lactate/ureidoglycolate dehydrogenase
MIEVKWGKLKVFINEMMLSLGMSEENAAVMTEVYSRATARGVGHHDIYDLPGRIKDLSEKKLNPKPEIRSISRFNAMESYCGDNGPGEICSNFIVERAMELSEEYGISICTICDSNHYLASAPYVEKAAEKGYLAILFTKGSPIMGAPGRKEHVISSCPMGFGAPTNKEYSIVHDLCLAYSSYGTLAQKVKLGESVPSHWGMDKNGQPTTNPAEINSGTVAPIGEHKGFGLAVLGEILTGILSGGQIIDEPHPQTGETGVASQAVIVIKPGTLISEDTFKERTTEMIDRMEARAPGIRIPGQNSSKSKHKIEKESRMYLETQLVERLNDWAQKLGVNPLENKNL